MSSRARWPWGRKWRRNGGLFFCLQKGMAQCKWVNPKDPERLCEAPSECLKRSFSLSEIGREQGRQLRYRSPKVAARRKTTGFLCFSTDELGGRWGSREPSSIPFMPQGQKEAPSLRPPVWGASFLSLESVIIPIDPLFVMTLFEPGFARNLVYHLRCPLDILASDSAIALSSWPRD